VLKENEIIVFDTGSGARFIVDRLEKHLEQLKFKIVTDRDNAPYGSKTDKDILSLITKKLEPHLKQNKYCVIACNTATVNVIDDLRIIYPENIFFGIEPMIKTADKISKSRNVLLLATEATKKSNRFKRLKHKFGKDLNLISVDTSGWATEIDNGLDVDLSEAIMAYEDNNCDTIILGCSHYLGLDQRLRNVFPESIILEPSDALAKVIKARLQL
jgi:glutamate racemase